MKRTPTVWHRLLADRIPRPAAKWSRMFLLATLVGVVCGSVSAVLEWALHHGVGAVVGRYAHLGSATAWEFKWGVLLLPALGGLISGLVVHWFCRDSRGHGTDELIRAFHRNLGNLPLRGPATKAVANVAVLSCGGSTGPEGPVAALSAAIGSAFGRVFPTTAHERRVLLVAGCAAG
ncbi:MAG: chloride channel protein, partial [Phycisphaerae bacterium]